MGLDEQCGRRRFHGVDRQIDARQRPIRTDELAAGLRALGVRTFATEAYFFLADFAPHDAGWLASRLEERGILVKPLKDERLGPGFIRVTTALPEDNTRFLATMRELL